MRSKPINFRPSERLTRELDTRSDPDGGRGHGPGSTAMRDVGRYYTLMEILRDGPMGATLSKFEDSERERIRDVLTGEAKHDLSPGQLAAAIEDADTRKPLFTRSPGTPIARGPEGPMRIVREHKPLSAKLRELDTVTICVLVDSLGMRP